ncbi:beta-ribofuranosylaminobenzene 5'-phosphate synthase family protein [Methylocystis sp. ATCC 49242]|uniref:beta-ribofuranosylaminobenzene 5'-phosphate synthase family protein n=1 Tax=Methylocystis sp. ATCC 49242 TaxID=622637 RepID=UPI0001F86A4D|nr:beta-ribofuranosylaminobenzene 5'-phosphate synthase family protein [Methylocystis sp. ATCC 49242]
MSAQASVTATARLHLGFLDMNGGLGRKFGGLGLSLDSPATRLTLTRAPANRVEGPESERAARLLEKAQAALTPDARHSLVVHEAIPAHSGFGSGTQLALAVAAALRRLEDLPHDPAADAAMTSRGARSGLGAGLFATGGVVVDGGRGPQTKTPPVIARAEFPEDWRVLLVSDPTAVGLHGSDEREAFATLPPLSEAASGELCRLVLMQALPALAERELAPFGAAVTRIQEIVGDYFAPAQGGRRYTSAKVEQLVAGLLAEGATGVGQTSWGPTGFAFVESEAAARRLVERFAAAAGAQELALTIHRGLNRGARIEAVYARIA